MSLIGSIFFVGCKTTSFSESSATSALGFGEIADDPAMICMTAQQILENYNRNDLNKIVDFTLHKDIESFLRSKPKIKSDLHFQINLNNPI
jgi:hypothetical protein